MAGKDLAVQIWAFSTACPGSPVLRPHDLVADAYERMSRCRRLA
jgi:hypothetical protein